ncbi:MAG: glycogen synthase GlgA [Nitrospira defluvii]|nr:glycogen synthase GlgA [Nitrospira defluvii]
MKSTQDHRPLKICMVSSEVVPYAKTGGLADVVGALAIEFAQLGHEVCVILPCYRQVESRGYQMTNYALLSVPTGYGLIETQIQEIAGPPSRVTGPGRLRVFVVRHDQYFARPGLYQEAGLDYPDNFDRFVFFCRAVMELLVHFGEKDQWQADLLHLHDWQSALCALYLRTIYQAKASFSKTRSVLTIHNLGYQGLFPAEHFALTGLSPQLFTPAALEFYGAVNLLKGGIVFADLLTTVSPTYSHEIQTAEYGCGLDGVIRARKHVLHGIVNGIDAEIWDPAKDVHLAAPYSLSDMSGKARCKKALQQELGLHQQNVPLLGVIARLTSQKGIDLVIEIIPELMELNVQLAILGTGDVHYEQQVRELAAGYPGRVALRNVFDEGLAHRIEAGADMFIMPSRYEPCGLSQLYSLRYGTVPVVRKTGGLADTVVNYTPRNLKGSRATGFSFADTSATSLLTCLLLALSVYRKKTDWQRIVKAGMEQDLSWARSAAIYIQLFQDVLLTDSEGAR